MRVKKPQSEPPLGASPTEAPDVDEGRLYLARVLADAQEAAETAEPPASPQAGAPAHIRLTVSDAVERIVPDAVALAEELHADPETAFREFRAVSAVGLLLARHQTPCEAGAFGLPTAFDARVGSGNAPRVAVLAEYDALPELGHACGHNIICATAVAAFFGAAAVVADLGGTVRLIGTPAEEGGGGKERIAQAGGFRGLDAVVMVHPAGFDTAEHPWLGARSATVRYHGMAAHAAATPFLGRNALDALVLAYQGLSQLRQHLLPEQRVHMIITDGGSAPGVIPALAAGRVAVRASTGRGLRELSERAEDIMLAAAQATGTRCEFVWDERPAYMPVRSNGPLASRYAVNIAAQGRRVVPPGILPSTLSGSTDLGNVSVRVPAIHPLIKVSPPDVAIHTAQFATYTTGAPAHSAVRDGAVALALTVADFLADEELRAAVADAFAAEGGAVEPEALLAPSSPAPAQGRAGAPG